MTRERCDYPGCSDQGAVWWKGLWCASCARKWGRLPSLAFRFAEIHRMNVAAETSGDRPAATTRTSGRIPSSFVRAGTHYSEGSRPRGRAVMATSSAASVTVPEPPAGEPSPVLSEAELLDILEREDWGTPWTDC